MRYGYAYEEAKVTGRPPEIEMHAHNTAGDFGRASGGIVERRGRHGRIKNPTGDRVYLVLEGEPFPFGGEEGKDEETGPVVKDDALLIPKGTVYDHEGRMRLFLSHSSAYEPDSDVHHDDPRR